MFLRWTSREGRSRSAFGPGPDRHWRAILVESVRINGKPRQRHVAYLVGFTEKQLKLPVQRVYIWETVEERLANLSNRVDAKSRESIVSSIAAKIGDKPNETQRESLLREARGTLAKFGRMG